MLSRTYYAQSNAGIIRAGLINGYSWLSLVIVGYQLLLHSTSTLTNQIALFEGIDVGY